MALDRANHVDPVQQIALSEQDGLSPAKPTISQKCNRWVSLRSTQSYAPIWVREKTEIFLQRGLDSQITKQPVGQSASRGWIPASLVAPVAGPAQAGSVGSRPGMTYRFRRSRRKQMKLGTR
jgi:hypothetical protein